MKFAWQKKKPKTKDALEDELQAQTPNDCFLEVFEADGHLALEVARNGILPVDSLEPSREGNDRAGSGVPTRGDADIAQFRFGATSIEGELGCVLGCVDLHVNPNLGGLGIGSSLDGRKSLFVSRTRGARLRIFERQLHEFERNGACFIARRAAEEFATGDLDAEALFAGFVGRRFQKGRTCRAELDRLVRAVVVDLTTGLIDEARKVNGVGIRGCGLRNGAAEAEHGHKTKSKNRGGG